MASTLTLLRPGRLDAEARTAYTMLLPVIVLFVLFQYYPILKTIGVSFFEYGLLRRTTPFVGLGHYIRQFHDPLFLSALANTLVFVAGTVAVGVVLALGFAVLVEKAGRWASVYRTLYFIPVVTSLMATAMIWRWLYAPNGLFNFLLGLVGVAPQPWLLSESSALACLMALTVWKNLGFDLILFSAALQAIPDDLYEAASLEGAGPVQQFRRITFPLLKPFVNIAIVLNTIYVFNSFPIIWVMTQGGPANSTDILVTYLYKMAFRLGKLGEASAVSLIMLAILLVFTAIYIRLAMRGERA